MPNSYHIKNLKMTKHWVVRIMLKWINHMCMHTNLQYQKHASTNYHNFIFLPHVNNLFLKSIGFEASWKLIYECHEGMICRFDIIINWFSSFTCECNSFRYTKLRDSFDVHLNLIEI